MAEKKIRNNTGQREITYHYNGQDYSLLGISKVTGYSYHAIYRKLRAGKTIEEALNECAADPKTWIGNSRR